MTRLEEIKARLKAATPGPWRVIDTLSGVQVYADGAELLDYYSALESAEKALADAKLSGAAGKDKP